MTECFVVVKRVFHKSRNSYYFKILYQIFIWNPKLSILYVRLKIMRKVKISFSPTSRITKLNKKLIICLWIRQYVVRMFWTDCFILWCLFWRNYHWMIMLKCLNNLMYHFLFIFNINVFSNIPRQIPKSINWMSHIYYLITTIQLSISFFQY